MARRVPPEFYLQKAAEARRAAEGMLDGPSRSYLLRRAAAYEDLARVPSLPESLPRAYLRSRSGEPE